jgi:hypothetical protein
MSLKKTFAVFILLFALKADAQQMSYEDALQKAIAHRQTQNAAHVILWNTEHFLLNIDSFSVDQNKSVLTVQSGKFIIKYNIKILGTYDAKDSTFLWSIYNSSIDKNLTTPVSNLISVAAANHWPLEKSYKIKNWYDSVYQLTTLAFYLDNANGINHIWTNGRRTCIFFSFYDVEVYDKRIKSLLTKVPVKKQYNVVDAPALIAVCKNYVTEFDANEKKYSQLYKEHSKDWKYHDTMFANRVKISDKYWDTTSVQYVFFRKNRLQAQDTQSIINWRVIEVEGDRYVLYDEKESWGSLKTWAFKMCQVNRRNKICNEYLCF